MRVRIKRNVNDLVKRVSHFISVIVHARPFRRISNQFDQFVRRLTLVKNEHSMTFVVCAFLICPLKRQNDMKRRNIPRDSKIIFSGIIGQLLVPFLVNRCKCDKVFPRSEPVKNGIDNLGPCIAVYPAPRTSSRYKIHRVDLLYRFVRQIRNLREEISPLHLGTIHSQRIDNHANYDYHRCMLVQTRLIQIAEFQARTSFVSSRQYVGRKKWNGTK